MSLRSLGNPAGIAVTWDGLDQFQRMCEELAGDPGEGLEVVIEEQLEMIGRRADYYCPKDTHSLVDSRQVWVQEGARGLVDGAITYGGGPVGVKDPAEYALFVHEDPVARHKPPTRWKWLQAAFDEKRAAALKAIAAAFELRVTRAGRLAKR